MQNITLFRQILSFLLFFAAFNLESYQMISERHEIKNYLIDPGLQRTAFAIFSFFLAVLVWRNGYHFRQKTFMRWLVILLVSFFIVFFWGSAELLIYHTREPLRLMIGGDIIVITILFSLFIRNYWKKKIFYAE